MCLIWSLETLRWHQAGQPKKAGGFSLGFWALGFGFDVGFFSFFPRFSVGLSFYWLRFSLFCLVLLFFGKENQLSFPFSGNPCETQGLSFGDGFQVEDAARRWGLEDAFSGGFRQKDFFLSKTLPVEMEHIFFCKMFGKICGVERLCRKRFLPS